MAMDGRQRGISYCDGLNNTSDANFGRNKRSRTPQAPHAIPEDKTNLPYEPSSNPIHLTRPPSPPPFPLK